jgi:hypothetical protein
MRLIPSITSRAALALLLSAAATAASGQVVKCQDPKSGKVTYTDGACSTGHQSSEVMPAQSAANAALEREQAYQARARVSSEIAAQNAREVRQPPVQQQPIALGGSTKSADCERARRVLKLRESSISRNPGDIRSAMVDVQVACDIDMSPYAPREVFISRGNGSVRSTPQKCYVGPRGGRYTLNANGTKNYGGC